MVLGADQIILPFLWRRYLNAARAGIATVAIGWIAYRNPTLSSSWPATTPFVAILAISTASLRGRWMDRLDPRNWVAAAIDLLCYLLCLWLLPPDAFWLVASAALYLVLSVSSLLEWPFCIGCALISVGAVGIARSPHAPRLFPVLILLSVLGTILAVQRHRLLNRLSQLSLQSVLYRQELIRAKEDERERIAADFHDGPLQSFISFQMRLEIVRRMLEKNFDAGMNELRELRELSDKQGREMRTFVRSMRPVEVEGAGLAAALRNLTGTFQKDSRIPTVFEAAPDASHDDIEPSMDLIQVTREALNNVQKHSNASRVLVQLARDSHELSLTVTDDGTGFPFAGVYTLEELDRLGLGPASIKRRVHLLRGDLTVESQPGHGATIRVRVPL